jgi:hypothetical protein
VNWWGGCSSIYPNKPLLSLQMLAINFLFWKVALAVWIELKEFTPRRWNTLSRQ